MGEGLAVELTKKVSDLLTGDGPDGIAVPADGEGRAEHGGVDPDAARVLDPDREGGTADRSGKSSGNLADGGSERQGPVGGLLAAQKHSRQRRDHLGENVIPVPGGGRCGVGAGSLDRRG